MKELHIKQPDFCKKLGDEVWEYLVHDLKNDNEFNSKIKKYYAAQAAYEEVGFDIIKAKKYAKKMQEAEREVNVRVSDFSMYWIKKYGSAELSLSEVMSILDGEDKEKFILRATTIAFLADFMEDCFIEMNDKIKKVLPDAKYVPLKAFIEQQKKLSAFTREILDSEGERYQELFDEHAAAIKMTIYNKVNGFINSEEDMKNKIKNDKYQLSFNFKEDES